MSRARVTYDRVILLAVCTAGFLFSGHPLCADAQVVAEESSSVHLTHVRTMATIPVPSAALQRHPSLLILPITHITNESLAPISVYAYLTWSDPAGGEGLARLLLGQISVFPANRPGTFTIRLPQEFQDLLKRSPDIQQRSPSLVLELRPIHDQPLPTMELTVGPVEWRTVEESSAT